MRTGVQFTRSAQTDATRGVFPTRVRETPGFEAGEHRGVYSHPELTFKVTGIVKSPLFYHRFTLKNQVTQVTGESSPAPE